MQRKILYDEELLEYVNTDHAIHYIKTIYKNCLDVDIALMAECRKLGNVTYSDGSTSFFQDSSAAQLLQFKEDNWQEGLAQWTARQIIKAAPLGIGAFMCPGLLNDRVANDESVSCLVSICVDFDTGNPDKNLKELSHRLGVPPTISATSGGTTDEGHHKLHAHWRLDEPCDEPWKVAYIREQLALAFDGDTSFKRIPQVIRIPGSLYDKKGRDTFTEIVEFNDNEIGV